MNEFNIKALNDDFRIKKLNAIELLAIRTNISNDSVKDSINTFKFMLEFIEVRVDTHWLPVKMEGKEVYMPSSIEDNIEAIQELITEFMSYLKSVFSKSNE